MNKVLLFQPRPQSSTASQDVTSPVKLTERIRARFQASSAHSHSASWPRDEAVVIQIWTPFMQSFYGLK